MLIGGHTNPQCVWRTELHGCCGYPAGFSFISFESPPDYGSLPYTGAWIPYFILWRIVRGLCLQARGS